MSLLRSFPDDVYASALEDWSWLDLTGKVPLFTSSFGDAFLQDDDGIWFLDMVDGSLHNAFGDVSSMQDALASPAGQERFLLAGLALAAERQGLAPGPDDVYSFRTPPVLGGPLELDNIEIAPFVVVASLAGQIHRQVKDLPPGTPVSGFSVAPTAPATPGGPRKRRGLFGRRS